MELGSGEIGDGLMITHELRGKVQQRKGIKVIEGNYF